MIPRTYQQRDFEEKWVQAYFESIFFHNTHKETRFHIFRDHIPYPLKMKYSLLKKWEKEMAVDFRACTGRECPFYHQCSYSCGLREARESHIIVGNHALMFSWPKAFPRPGHIIVDEAHRLESEATDAFSLQVTQEDLDTLERNLLHLTGVGSLFYLLSIVEEGGPSPSQISDKINELRDKTIHTGTHLGRLLTELRPKVEEFFKRIPGFTEQYWNEIPMLVPSTAKDPLEIYLIHSFEEIWAIVHELYDVFLPFHGRWEPMGRSEQQVTAITRFETFFTSLEDMDNAFKVVLAGGAKKEKIFTQSLRYHAQDGLILQASPIDIGKILHSQILEPGQSVVLTSATLGTAAGDGSSKGVEWASGHAYLSPQKRFKAPFFLPAVYRYAEKSKVFLCDDVPSLGAPEFVPSVLKPIMELINLLQGRSLLLFSAKTRFETAREILLQTFGQTLPVFIQGMGPHVVEDFKKAKNGILLGMESMGEGIDVPGDTLSFLFVDKIPDLRQDLVIKDRREFYERQFGNEFQDYYLAHRARSLAQKLGRLLRTESDFGAAIVVDKRIKNWKGPTLEKMAKLMAPYQLERKNLTQACQSVSEFLVGQGLKLEQ